MRHVQILLWLLATGGFVAFTSPCMAEMHMYEGYEESVITLSGGVIAPASPQKRIRMDLMEINIRMKAGSYVLDAVFHLFNTGEATKEWIGFPKHGKASGYVSDDNRLICDFVRFEGWVNGCKEQFVEKRPFLRSNSYPFPEPRITGFGEETRWMAKEIILPKSALTTIRIRYEAPYYFAVRSRPEDVGYFCFGPGQYWKGNITKAEFVLDNNDSIGENRGMAFRDPGTKLIQKTITEARNKYELKELDPRTSGVLVFSQTPAR